MRKMIALGLGLLSFLSVSFADPTQNPVANPEPSPTYSPNPVVPANANGSYDFNEGQQGYDMNSTLKNGLDPLNGNNNGTDQSNGAIPGFHIAPGPGKK